MDVRRGVLRCSSRKLRSSSFVELVALDTNRRQKLKSLQRPRKYNSTFYGKTGISGFKVDISNCHDFSFGRDLHVLMCPDVQIMHKLT